MKKNYKDWIISLYEIYGLNQEANIEVYKHYDEGIDAAIIPEETEKEHFKRYCRAIRLQLVKNGYFDRDTDEQDTINHNISLMKKNQRQQDLLRIERKTFRETSRLENALVEVSKELMGVLEKVDLHIFTKEHNVGHKKYALVVQISDPHFNELVRPTTSLKNKYDFSEAGKRLKKFSHHIKSIGEAYGVGEVILCFTGDLINSDRRLDEKLSMATNRASSVVLSCFLLEQFIIDLNEKFNVSIASVIGNESRLSEEVAHSEVIATDNWDMVIDKILRVMFRNSPGIKFIDGSYNEKVVGIGNFNLLMLHGDKLKHTSIDREIYSKMAKYGQSGIVIDYVIYGHLHQASISDWYARSGSLVGANAYSDEGLNLISKASQNFFLICPESKEIHSFRIDLQDTSNIEGYDIKKEIEEYNAKSGDKLHENKVIVQVVI